MGWLSIIIGLDDMLYLEGYISIQALVLYFSCFYSAIPLKLIKPFPAVA